MKPGHKLISFLSFLTILFLLSIKNLYSQEKISTAPLINLDQIKPSFEELEDKYEILNGSNDIKIKEKKEKISEKSHAILIGLDKITAKSSQIIVNINKKKNFGPLEIKIVKCGKVKLNNKFDDVAYMQVKDLTKSENEKVYIFNGWTFSSDPNITPFDHAIYDLQLINCNNV